jgi:hypothetical protein
MSEWTGSLADELIMKVGEVFQLIRQEILVSVSEEWTKRLKWVAEDDEEYHHE